MIQDDSEGGALLMGGRQRPAEGLLSRAPQAVLGDSGRRERERAARGGEDSRGERKSVNLCSSLPLSPPARGQNQIPPTRDYNIFAAASSSSFFSAPKIKWVNKAGTNH